jgi:hypothetical protein
MRLPSSEADSRSASQEDVKMSEVVLLRSRYPTPELILFQLNQIHSFATSFFTDEEHCCEGPY